jgi:hypothetical protein
MDPLHEGSLRCLLHSPQPSGLPRLSWPNFQELIFISIANRPSTLLAVHDFIDLLFIYLFIDFCTIYLNVFYFLLARIPQRGGASAEQKGDGHGDQGRQRRC